MPSPSEGANGPRGAKLSPRSCPQKLSPRSCPPGFHGAAWGSHPKNGSHPQCFSCCHSQAVVTSAPTLRRSHAEGHQTLGRTAARAAPHPAWPSRVTLPYSQVLAVPNQLPASPLPPNSWVNAGLGVTLSSVRPPATRHQPRGLGVKPNVLPHPTPAHNKHQQLAGPAALSETQPRPLFPLPQGLYLTLRQHGGCGDVSVCVCARSPHAPAPIFVRSPIPQMPGIA